MLPQSSLRFALGFIPSSASRTETPVRHSPRPPNLSWIQAGVFQSGVARTNLFVRDGSATNSPTNEFVYVFSVQTVPKGRRTVATGASPWDVRLRVEQKPRRGDGNAYRTGNDPPPLRGGWIIPTANSTGFAALHPWLRALAPPGRVSFSWLTFDDHLYHLIQGDLPLRTAHHIVGNDRTTRPA